MRLIQDARRRRENDRLAAIRLQEETAQRKSREVAERLTEELRQREPRKVARLVGMLDRWESAERRRRFMATCRAAAMADAADAGGEERAARRPMNPATAEFLTWAEGVAERTDPLATGNDTMRDAVMKEPEARGWLFGFEGISNGAAISAWWLPKGARGRPSWLGRHG